MIRVGFDTEWYVAKEGGAEVVGPITLPYDAMLGETRDHDTKNEGHTGFYPGGVYRYSKTFHAPEEWRGKSVTIEFEGVYQRSQVFLNGRLVGGRPSGYALFHVELDDALEIGAANFLEVVADNSVIPNSRWYTGSGIYRPTHLLVGGPIRVAPTGLRLSTDSLQGTTAMVKVDIAITNDHPTDRAVTLVVDLASPDSRAVSHSAEVVLPAGSTTTATLMVSVPDAQLWSPETPQLHGATVTVVEGGVTLDFAEDEFGIRVVTADARHGLRINGTAMKLRGAAIHHDNGVIGAVALDAAEDRRIRLLKASGFNAIRSAHNPASRALLRACDRNGVLVMDELTDAWTRPKVRHDYSELFEEWWERDLEALVANAHNHPSVIMYSIGNEISETANPSGIATNRKLAQRTRELDPTRLVTNGINGFLNLIAPKDGAEKKPAKPKDEDEAPNKNMIRILNALIGILTRLLDRIVRLKAVDRRTREAFADLDVAGYNYMQGRYTMDGRLHPDRVIVGSETRSTNTAEIYQLIEPLPYVIGDFTWTGWDYIGEAGLAAKQYGDGRRSIYQPYPALLAGEPVIDITGFRQTQSYVNEIGWHLATGPHIAVQPVNHAGEKAIPNGWRRTDSLASWSWEGCEGRVATVEVYADAATIALELNGRLVGRKTPSTEGNHQVVFTVPYAPGTLTAIASAADGSELARSSLTSAGPGLRLAVAPESSELRADGKDLVYVPITFTDGAGEVLPLADRVVTVTVSGHGTLAGFGSAEAITTEQVSSASHRSFSGRSLAVIRAGHTIGPVTLTASAEGCETVSVTISAVAPPTTSSPRHSALAR